MNRPVKDDQEDQEHSVNQSQKHSSGHTVSSPLNALERWVLRETLASEKLKTPIYFKSITAIGPMSTPDVEQAQRFNSKQEAMMSSAYVHPLSFYEPEPEPESLGANEYDHLHCTTPEQCKCGCEVCERQRNQERH